MLVSLEIGDVDPNDFEIRLMAKASECLNEFHSAWGQVVKSPAYQVATEGQNQQAQAMLHLMSRQQDLANGLVLCASARMNLAAQTLLRGVFETWATLLFIGFYQDDQYSSQDLGKRFLDHGMFVWYAQIDEMTRKFPERADPDHRFVQEAKEVIAANPHSLKPKGVWHPFNSFDGMWKALVPEGKELVVPISINGMNKTQWDQRKLFCWDVASVTVHANSASTVELAWIPGPVKLALMMNANSLKAICHVLGIGTLWDEVAVTARALYEEFCELDETNQRA